MITNTLEEAIEIIKKYQLGFRVKNSRSIELWYKPWKKYIYKIETNKWYQVGDGAIYGAKSIEDFIKRFIGIPYLKEGKEEPGKAIDELLKDINI